MAENRITLKVLDIYLDTDNPRHEPILDQPEIINHLVRKERVKILAKDISENGLSPLERIAVIKKEKKHIVVEGNRRICALQLLNDPEKSPQHAPYFKKLKTDKIPEKVECILFDNIEDSELWMSRRHGGEQGGVGLRTWSPEEQARFVQRGEISQKAKSSSTQYALAKSIIDYAVKQGYLQKDRSERILTTASRYLGNPIFRNALGITTGRSDPNVKIKIPIDSFNKIVMQFCVDLIENTKVNSRSRKEDWEGYADELKAAGLTSTTFLPSYELNGAQQPTSSNDSPSSKNTNSQNSSDDITKPGTNNNQQNGNNSSSQSNKNEDTHSNKKNNTQHPDNRKYIIPHYMTFTLNDSTLRRIFGELKTIEVKEHSLAVAMVTRVFLEKIYHLYFQKLTNNSPKGNIKTHDLIIKLIKKMDDDSNIISSLTREQKTALNMLRKVANDKHSYLSGDTLGIFAHGGGYPDDSRLKREFDNIAPIIQYFIDNI